MTVKLNIVKMATFPKLMYRFNIILIKTFADFYTELHKLILKFTWKFKVARIAKHFEKQQKS